MKEINSALKTHLSSEITTLATCWKIIRQDGTVMGFTDHDKDITVEGVVYQASTGFTPTAVSSSSALNVDNLDVEGMLDNEAITEKDLNAGLYDHAEIQVFQVNYQAPEQGVLTLRTGWLGEVQFNDGTFMAEVRGLTQRLSQTIGELYSPACRAQFGDTRCKQDISQYTFSGTLTGVSSNRLVIDSNRTESPGIFNGGVLRFISGHNQGIAMEVKSYHNGSISTVLPLPYPPQAGDNYTLSQGCDKRLTTCINRYQNVLNFRGEPHVPGLDKIMETSTTRSS